jgi:hypothetical protein
MNGNNGYVDVLTADHVALKNNYNAYIGIGATGGLIAPNVFQYTPLGVRGINGTEDLTVVQATLGNLTTNAGLQTLYNNITPLQIANPGPTGPGAGRATSVGASLTEYGYGDTGTPFTTTAPAGPFPAGTQGYYDTSSDFIMRFQNTTAASVNSGGPATYTTAPYNSGYKEPILGWTDSAPADPSLTNNTFKGMAFGGDSGGPFLTSYPSNFTITRNGNQTSGGVLTDYIDAIEGGGSSYGSVTTNGTNSFALELNGGSEYAVYIDQYNAAWINNVVTGVIPEPASATLLVTAAVGALARRRRRA